MPRFATDLLSICLGSASAERDIRIFHKQLFYFVRENTLFRTSLAACVEQLVQYILDRAHIMNTFSKEL